MGTHPIFESDFDCLTELKNGVSRAKIGHPGHDEKGYSVHGR